MGDQATDHSTIFTGAQRIDAAHQQIHTLQSRLSFETERPGDNTDFDRIYKDFDDQFDVIASSLCELHESLNALSRTFAAEGVYAPANASLKTALHSPEPPALGNPMDSTTQELTRAELLEIGRQDLFNLIVWLKEGLDANAHNWDQPTRNLYEDVQDRWAKAMEKQEAIIKKSQASSEFSV